MVAKVARAKRSLQVGARCSVVVVMAMLLGACSSENDAPSGAGGTATVITGTGGDATGGAGSAAVTGGTGSAATTGGTGSAAVTGGTGSAAVTGGTGSAAVTGGTGSAAATGGTAATETGGASGAPPTTGGNTGVGGSGGAGHGPGGVAGSDGGGQGGAPVDPEPPGNDATQLYKKYEDYFIIGAAVDPGSYQDAHAAIWREHFNGAVVENSMKWDSLQPTEGNFSFDQANAMVNAARANGMLVRGHTLVWFNQTPDWVFQGSKEQVLQRIRDHVTRVMQEFQGRVYAWDVVNEAVIGYDRNNQDVGEDLATLDRWGYRDSRWYQIAGEDHIFEAFRAARAADPDAKLFYNDFWNYLDGKREFILSFVRRLRDEGLIDGVGLQCHLNISPAQEVMTNQTVYQTVENLEKEIQEYAALGLDVHVTELDISIYTRDYGSSDQSRWFTGDALTDELQDKLAARYREFFEMFRRNADKIQNVTFWGIADDNTWLSELSSGRPDHPLLFDRQLQPKKAFHAIMDF